MNKGTLVDNVYEACRYNKDGQKMVNREQVSRVVDEVFKQIENGLYRDREVKIMDFGTFSVERRRSREINNSICEGKVIPPHNVVKFKVSEKIKENIW